MEGQELQTAPQSQRAIEAWTPQDVMAQVATIQGLMKAGMKRGDHFGVIPGTNKPTLLKPGAEKLCLMFRLAPKYEITRTDLGNGHREIAVTCSLYHINTEKFWGAGVGSCSTMETKYRYRTSKRKCPKCNQEAIIKTKGGRNPGGYWCVPDKGGCGSNFNPGDPTVENQVTGRAENPELADTYNTVLKMAKKRALVDATLNATAASDIFTQDVEDFADEAHAVEVETPQPIRINQEAGEALIAAAKAKGITTGAIARQANVQRLSEITVDQLPGLMKWIELQTLPKEIDKEFDAVFESLIRAGVANADLSDYIESLGMDRASLTDHLKKLMENFKKEALPQVFLNKAEVVRKAASK